MKKRKIEENDFTTTTIKVRSFFVCETKNTAKKTKISNIF
jgi:hypothetical protein